jgi:hypothetical protein
MKKLITCVCLFLVSASISTQGGFINGGFESGDLSGWEVGISGGDAHLSQGWMGNYLTDNTLDQVPNLFDMFPYQYPRVIDLFPFFPTPIESAEGNNFLSIPGTEAVPYHHEIENDYWWEVAFSECTTSVSQSVYLEAGDVVSGQIAFVTSELVPEWNYDAAFVQISDYSSIDAPVEISIDDLPGGYFSEYSGWQHWSWTAPYNGDFKISLSNRMDCEQVSCALFDGLKITSVPEPSTYSFYIFSVFLLLSFGFFRVNKNRINSF